MHGPIAQSIVEHNNAENKIIFKEYTLNYFTASEI